MHDRRRRAAPRCHLAHDPPAPCAGGTHVLWISSTRSDGNSPRDTWLINTAASTEGLVVARILGAQRLLCGWYRCVEVQSPASSQPHASAPRDDYRDANFPLETSRQFHEFANELLRLRPPAIARGRIEVSHVSDVDKAAAPRLRRGLHAIEAPERIVLACGDDAEEKLGRCLRGWRHPAVLLQDFLRGIAFGQRRLQVGRRSEQRSLDRASVSLRPVRDDHAAGAVGGQYHGAFDLREGLIELGDPRDTRKLVADHPRHAPRIGQLILKEGLPVLRHIVAQAGDSKELLEKQARSCARSRSVRRPG